MLLIEACIRASIGAIKDVGDLTDPIVDSKLKALEAMYVKIADALWTE